MEPDKEVKCKTCHSVMEDRKGQVTNIFSYGVGDDYKIIRTEVKSSFFCRVCKEYHLILVEEQGNSGDV